MTAKKEHNDEVTAANDEKQSAFVMSPDDDEDDTPGDGPKAGYPRWGAAADDQGGTAPLVQVIVNLRTLPIAE